MTPNVTTTPKDRPPAAFHKLARIRQRMAAVVNNDPLFDRLAVQELDAFEAIADSKGGPDLGRRKLDLLAQWMTQNATPDEQRAMLLSALADLDRRADA